MAETPAKKSLTTKKNITQSLTQKIFFKQAKHLCNPPSHYLFLCTPSGSWLEVNRLWAEVCLLETSCNQQGIFILDTKQEDHWLIASRLLYIMLLFPIKMLHLNVHFSH